MNYIEYTNLICSSLFCCFFLKYTYQLRFIEILENLLQSEMYTLTTWYETLSSLLTLHYFLHSCYGGYCKFQVLKLVPQVVCSHRAMKQLQSNFSFTNLQICKVSNMSTILLSSIPGTRKILRK